MIRVRRDLATEGIQHQMYLYRIERAQGRHVGEFDLIEIFKVGILTQAYESVKCGAVHARILCESARKVNLLGSG